MMPLGCTRFARGCVNTWKAADTRQWTFGDKLITGHGRGLGEYSLSYALNVSSGTLLNGRISANLRLIHRGVVGAGLLCRADEGWNFIAFYTAPDSPDADFTFARFGICSEGQLTNVATSEQPVIIGPGYNRFSLEFFSGQLRGEIQTKEGSHELIAECVELPFPGYTGVMRLYETSLMVTEVVVQHTSIPLVESSADANRVDDAISYDVFLCHSSADKYLIRDVAKTFASRGISYWLDEEQIAYGDPVTDKIEDGLRRSRYVVPCVSANFATSNWTRAEYGSILNAELSGPSTRTVIPLVLDESDDGYLPLLLRDKKRAFYANKTEFEHFLLFLLRR